MRIATTGFAGTNGTDIETADSNWTEHSSYTSGSIIIASNRARVSGTATGMYYRDETPGSANQRVKAACYQHTFVQSNSLGVTARVNTGANTMFSAVLGNTSTNQSLKLFKFVAGTATQLGSDYTLPSQPSDGSTHTLELLVTGQSPNIEVSLLWDGSVVIGPITVNDTNLDATGKTGIRWGANTNSISDSTGRHIDTWWAYDDVAATLSSPTGTATGTTTASGTVSVNDAGGTLYAVATTSATDPTHTQIQAGHDHTGAAAAFAVGGGAGQAVSATGSQGVSATGLAPATTYYWHYSYKDGGGTNAAAVVSSAGFTTDADAVLGVRVQLFRGGVPQINLTGIRVLWWDAATPSGAPDDESTTETTDGSAWAEIDIDAVTSQSVGGNVFLLAYWLDGTNHQDSLVFAGKLPIVDIS